MWLLGLVIEAVADDQKRQFQSNADNKGKFINTGIWRWSRHPNYFGEILLWISFALFCANGLHSPLLQVLASVAPSFIVFLLLRISGIPLQEKQAKQRWGSDPA
jgi:steroid 5-alpha reductase family enzyme